MKKYKSIGLHIAKEQYCSTGLPLCESVVFNMEEEIWKDVVGYEGCYQVSNFGRIKSMWSNKIRSSADNGHGYKFIPLTRNGKSINHYVHRLVALCFIPNPLNKSTVNHKNGDKSNNYVYNLEWATQSENSQHGFDTGLIKQKSGADNPNSRCVIQISKQGDIIKEYACIVDAENSTGIKQQNIGMACMGKYKQSGGFLWKYKNPIK